ncbi:ATP-binding protein [Mycolicibacterium komossense]|uniref:histidine kinase n=2 Tax=Mycolicibacterium komossense TaxID=1779 RepID=A0ABT3CDK9_9MYCO|nr:ATP-binding protein [Mycolicibacterium komossense]
MIGLIVLITNVGAVKNWLPAVYNTTLLVYFIAAVLWLSIVLRGRVPAWTGWLSTTIDIVAIVTLCLSSGGATAWLLPVFFLLPILIAFQDRPWLTGALGAATAVAYLAVWIVYSKRDDTVGLPNIVYVHFAFLFWFALATTALCLVLSRRTARVKTLLEMRRQLVSESMRADEISSRELAETLHDGPLQNLLAARLDLEELAERYHDPDLEAVRLAVTRTATQLRSTLTTLHPAVLAELGLAAAVRELVHQYAGRDHFDIETELTDVGKPLVQDLLYRAARELLTNVVKHADATRVLIRLERDDRWITLSVIDNGKGFDPALVDKRITEGHIGLASLVARAEAMGGTMEFVPAEGGGTRATITTPAAAA